MAVLRISRPVFRESSRLIQFRDRIPKDILKHPRLRAGLRLAIPVGGETVHKHLSPQATHVALSLQTADGAEGKRRHDQVTTYLAGTWAALRRTAPVTLMNLQVTALAGELYRAWADGEGSRGERIPGVVHRPDGGGKLKARDGSTWDPTTPSTAEEDEPAFAKWASEILAADPEAALGPLVDRLLLAKGIADVDAETREALLVAFQRALGEAFQARQRNAGGDFAPDPIAGRFPAWPSSSFDKAPSLTLPELVELWWTEAKAIGRKPATYSNYKRAFEHLARYLKHDDARRVTAEDIVGFKAWRLASVSPQTKKPISPLTIRGNELGGLKTIFAFAVASKLLPANPALGVSVPRIATAHRSRSKSLTDEEALALLHQASSSQRLSNEMASTAAARRFVPWLLAFTGARVGEMCQLRKEDVRREGNHWVVTITPEAGTVKGNAQREVVIHPQVIEQGFLKFVDAAPAGHLFLNVGPGGRVLGVLKGLKTRLAYCAREVVSDPLVAPQHGWRHRFKTVGMAAHIPPRWLDAIQGHAGRTAGESYGDVTIAMKAEAIAKLPRYAVQG